MATLPMAWAASTSLFESPIMIDSTEAKVIEKALEAIPGRSIINSINMENGRERIDKIVPLAKKHGAALVALTIDPVGMAKTRDRKLEIARKIHDIVVGEYGLAPADFFLSPSPWRQPSISNHKQYRLIRRESTRSSTGAT